ncbi:MAG: M23 family metallopeptidase [Hyphomonas sp.]|nr:M23 family metallopeptidase [Hyphomonas sp.]
MKSLVALGALGAVSVLVGLMATGPGISNAPGTAEAAIAPPPLAATLLTATEITGPGPAVTHEAGRLQRRETLTGLVTRLGAPTDEAAAALHTLYDQELIDPRRLLPGLEAEVMLEEGHLRALTVKAEPGRNLFITSAGGGKWTAAALNARLSENHARIAAPIETSIYDAALQLGAGDQQVVDFASTFAYDVDFQREIHPGDSFEMVYETYTDEAGKPVKSGNLVYAALKGQALTRAFYRFTPSDDGETDYFDENGESATKFLMKTPINGARISSSFGNRRHPISGYTRLHKGTDFAAPTGTPVYAAGNGTVEWAARKGGYGNYIVVKHANGYKTAYAHLSRYARGLKSGKRVRQGDTIGYVGSTGASTGPHLHYEVYIKGAPVNAMKLKLPTGRKLAESPDMLAEFLIRKAEIDGIRADKGAALMTVALSENPPSP